MKRKSIGLTITNSIASEFNLWQKLWLLFAEKKISCRRRYDALSGLIHGFAAVFSVPLITTLLFISSHSLIKLIAFTIYGLSMIGLFLGSLCYHWTTDKHSSSHQLFRKIDHAMIFVFIAGTYTPMCLITLQMVGGVSLLLVIWSLAIFGIISRILVPSQSRFWRTILYVLMGWLVVMSIGQLSVSMSGLGLSLLLFGGGIYTFGSLIYLFKWPNFSASFSFHDLWHVVVILGVFTHYLVMLLYVAPIQMA